MKILDVTIQNFSSFYGEHSFRMADRGLVFVQGENLDVPRATSNGAGKSSIFDAMDWCLWGKVPKKDDADSIINLEAGKDCQVIVRIQDGDQIYSIRRFRKKSGEKKPNDVEFYVGHEEGRQFSSQASGKDRYLGHENRSAMDMEVTQERINQALGLDREIFHAAVYRSQEEDFNFALATDGKRKEVLSKIIPELAEIDRLASACGQLLATAENAALKSRTESERLQAEIAALEMWDWQSFRAAWEGQRQQRLSEAEEAVRGAEHRRLEASRALASEEALQADKKYLMANPPVPDETQQKAHQEALEAQKAVHQEILLYQQSRGELEASKAHFLGLGQGVCSNCGQEISGAVLEAEIQRLTAGIAGIDEELGRLIPEEQALQAAVEVAQGAVWNAQAEFNTRVAEHGQRLGEVNTQLAALAQARQSLEFLDRDAARAKAVVEQIASESWPEQHKADQVQADLEHKKAKHASVQKILVAEERRLAVLGYWKQAFTGKGLKSLVLDSRLQDMTDAANEVVKLLTGGAAWVRFESQTLTKKGSFSEKLNIRVFRHSPKGGVIERNFRSWSGGEKARVALGIDEGLARLVAERASKTWDLKIIDESFRQHLDSGGREAIFELLEKLQADRSSIFVVDHDHEMAAQFEKTITVRIQNERSAIMDPEAEQWATDQNHVGQDTISPSSALTAVGATPVSSV